MATHRGGEMSSSLDVEQLLVDDLQVLSTSLTGAEHRDVCEILHRGIHLLGPCLQMLGSAH